jgi:hypothetical protein
MRGRCLRGGEDRVTTSDYIFVERHTEKFHRIWEISLADTQAPMPMYPHVSDCKLHTSDSIASCRWPGHPVLTRERVSR